MMIDISDILQEVGSSKDFEGNMDMKDTTFQGDEIRFHKPLFVKGNVINAGDVVALTAHIEGTATLQCGMCTEPYDYLLDFDIEVNLKSLHDEEDPDIYVYSDALIDLHDVVIREFLLNLPTRRRCTEECKGLCPYCGTNLNKGECQCEDEDHEPIDSRFAALKDFFVNRDREVE